MFRARPLSHEFDDETNPDVGPLPNAPDYVDGASVTTHHVDSLDYDRSTLSGWDIDPDHVHTLVSKDSVNYRDGNDDKNCGNCAMFMRRSKACDLVQGDIAADDLCDEWVTLDTTKLMGAELIKNWLKWDIEHGDKFGAGRKHGHELEKGDIIHHEKWGPVEITSARKVDASTGNRLLVVKDSSGKLHSAPIHKDTEVHVGKPGAKAEPGIPNKPAKLYHVSPSTNHESIAQSGIKGNHNGESWHFTSLEEARKNMKKGSTGQMTGKGGNDLWEVDTKGLNVQEDPELLGDSWLTVHGDIPPENIKHLDSAGEHVPEVVNTWHNQSNGDKMDVYDDGHAIVTHPDGTTETKDHVGGGYFIKDNMPVADAEGNTWKKTPAAPAAPKVSPGFEPTNGQKLDSKYLNKEVEIEQPGGNILRGKLMNINEGHFQLDDGTGKYPWYYSPTASGIREVKAPSNASSSSSAMPSYSDLMSYKKVPGPHGSNPIEWRQAPDGRTFAVKPTPAARAYNELAAGLVYKAAGVKFPNTAVVKDSTGKTYVVSEKIDNLHALSPSGWVGKPDLQAKAAQDYGIDALLSHWDVHGLSADNTLVDDKGNPVRIESGGAMAFRAMGAPKPSFAKGQPWVEPKSMRESEQGRRMYGKMSDATAADSLKRAGDLNINDIEQQWIAAGVPPADAKKWADVLRERQAQIPGIVAKLGGGSSTHAAKTYTPQDVKLVAIPHPGAHSGGSGLDAKGNPLKAYAVVDKQTGEHLGRIMQYRSVTTHHINSAQAKSGSQFTTESGWLTDRRDPSDYVNWSKTKKLYKANQGDALNHFLGNLNKPVEKMMATPEGFAVDTR